MSHFNQVTEAAIAYILMNESILLEDRLDYLKKNTKPLSIDHDHLAQHKDTPSIIQHFADNGDPTKNKSHTQYLVGLYRNKTIKQEDAPAAKEVLSNFEKHKGKLSPEDKQLTAAKYPKLSDVREKIAPHLGTATTKAEANKQLADNLNIPGKHPLLYEDDKIKIYHTADKETAQKIYCSSSDPKPGPHPTEWCTSRKTDNNRFDDYNSSGPLHVVHRKSDGAVFQYHPETTSFMDKDDNEISTDDFKSIAPSLHKAWEKILPADE